MLRVNSIVAMSAPVAACALLLAFLIGCDGNSNPGRSSGRIATGDVAAETGFKLFQERKFSEAIPHFERALKHPRVAHSESLVLTSLGNCYNELEQFEKSLEYHDEAILKDPDNHIAYVNRGVVYRLIGDFDKAAESYQSALELVPDYAELHASMGALSVHQGEYEAAVKHLERAIALNDSLAIAHSNYAYALANLGRFDEADEELEKATALGYFRRDTMKEMIDELRNSSKSAK